MEIDLVFSNPPPLIFSTGECTLTRPSSYFSLINYVDLIFDSNTKAKDSWKKLFEGYDEDKNEKNKTVQNSIEMKDNKPTAKDGQGRRMLAISDKKENEYFFKLNGPFSHIKQRAVD